METENNTQMEEIKAIDSVILESKTALAQSEQKEVKKRGRPAKKDSDKTASSIPLVNPAPVIPAGPSPIKPTFIAILDMTNEGLKLSLQTDCFKLNEFEKEILATQMDELSKEFTVSLSGKGAKAAMLITTASVIYGSKYLKYANEVENADKNKVNDLTKTNENGNQIN